ncbi:hypothetical protein E0L93_03355 [Rubrobacter taiwanensis]|uniref:Uncharacterized protein n=1 Tax=Rubrobacter taiwanensis TaxID=185139 RepID=A0A4R1BRR1_9ACTN|nr:hypothetical protein [Rubrobacter taiwanensis]TCJ19996.1 hypothetical protein E0L93_03355 [Rubrobacter taiwanensis]
MKSLKNSALGPEEERLAWEGLASACSDPVRRLGAFLVIGLVTFFAGISAVVLYYNFFGVRAVPHALFYATIAFGLLVALGGWSIWLAGSLRDYASFRRVLERSGLDARRPTLDGLGVYSDEQLLALRSRYENARRPAVRRLFERLFGFSRDDSFRSGPLNVRPGTFEMDNLRVEWEANLILLNAGSKPPEVGWWLESRMELLPRNPDETRKIMFALRYTRDSVRALKLRYGISIRRWHRTVPEGQLWDAMRDYDEARRLQLDLQRKMRR